MSGRVAHTHTHTHTDLAMLRARAGASSGIGIETALELSRRGARVKMLVRNLEKAGPVRDQIARETRGEVEMVKLDLSSLESVRECAEEIRQKEDKVHLLVNNAGIAVRVQLLIVPTDIASVHLVTGCPNARAGAKIVTKKSP